MKIVVVGASGVIGRAVVEKLSARHEVVSVGRFSLDAYLPSLPSIASILQATPEQVQLTLTFYFLGHGISQFFYGPLSEKYGRRRILLAGMTIFLSGSLACATAASIKALISSRILAGIGAGAGGVLARAIVSDSFPSKEIASVWAHITTAIVISLIGGPIVGAFIEQHLGFRYNFWLSLIYGLSVFLLAVHYLPETHIKKEKNALPFKKVLYSYGEIISNKKFITYIACSTLAFSSLAIFFQLSPFIFITGFSYTPVQYGLVLIGIACCYIAGGQLIRFYSKKRSAHQLIRAGNSLIFTAAMILIVWQLLASKPVALVVILAAFIFVVGARIIIPNSLSIGLTLYGHKAGYASALSGGGQMLGGTLISYSVAKLLSGSALHRLSFTLLLLSLLIAILLRTLSPPSPKNNLLHTYKS